MTPDSEMLFEVHPFGFPGSHHRRLLATTVNQASHLSGRLDDVLLALTAPKEIRVSRHDAEVFLFYRPGIRYWVVAVAKRLDTEGFLVTAYQTDIVKEGEKVWPK